MRVKAALRPTGPIILLGSGLKVKFENGPYHSYIPWLTAYASGQAAAGAAGAAESEDPDWKPGVPSAASAAGDKGKDMAWAMSFLFFIPFLLSPGGGGRTCPPPSRCAER